MKKGLSGARRLSVAIMPAVRPSIALDALAVATVIGITVQRARQMRFAAS
jgi:hypothetical protein